MLKVYRHLTIGTAKAGMRGEKTDWNGMLLATAQGSSSETPQSNGSARLARPTRFSLFDQVSDRH